MHFITITPHNWLTYPIGLINICVSESAKAHKKLAIIYYDTISAIIEFVAGKINVSKAWNGMEENLENLDQDS